jgi:hypothetical protein
VIEVRRRYCPLEGRERPRSSRRSDSHRLRDFTRGALLWLLGVPLPIVLLIALFRHH